MDPGISLAELEDAVFTVPLFFYPPEVGPKSVFHLVHIGGRDRLDRSTKKTVSETDNPSRQTFRGLTLPCFRRMFRA